MEHVRCDVGEGPRFAFSDLPVEKHLALVAEVPEEGALGQPDGLRDFRGGHLLEPAGGEHRWAAVHRSDAARLIALGLAKAPASARLHAVAEDGIPTRDIAEAIGLALRLPVTSIAPDDVQGHFGWIGTFFGMDLAATSTATRELLGWAPAGPTLIEDINANAYSARTPA